MIDRGILLFDVRLCKPLHNIYYANYIVTSIYAIFYIHVLINHYTK